jgi:glycosyltransferase involved in cell wall biosynthesis/GR25 family glycosyltransferase involved in LPS biosynthesis
VSEGGGEIRRQSICLSMIVRNEAHVVTDALASAAPHIDTWVIVDTGSTDGTQEVVRSFFAERGIAGEVLERPWRDFGTNRTEAIAACAGRADYAWVLDADDIVIGDLDLSVLDADAYRLRIGEGFVYWRPQLLRLDKRWRFDGVVHEYLVCLDDPHTEVRLPGDYHLESRRLGNRNRALDKYHRDAALLLLAYERDPDDPRTVFYLAQSCLDAGDLRAALQNYELRVTMGGWDEETFYARLQRARCLERLDAPWSDVESAYLECWQSRPSRAEPLHDLARFHRLGGRHDLGYLYARRADETPTPVDDDLFVATDVYEWRARDERAVAAYYTGRPRESFELTADLLRRNIPRGERPRIEGNLPFGVASAIPGRVRFPAALVSRLTGSGRPASARTDINVLSGPGLVTVTITTCRRRILFEQMLNSFLQCCEDVGRVDRWIVADDGSSPDDVEQMRARYPFLEVVTNQPGQQGHAASLNVLRAMVATPYWLHLEDDWLFLLPDRYVTRALAVLAAEPQVAQVLFNRNYAEALDDRDLVGSGPHMTVDGTNHFVHDYIDPDTAEFAALLGVLAPTERTNRHWPHFSLRPSLMRTQAIFDLGTFADGDSAFELDMARRYSAAGHQSAFFDSVSAIHLGPTTDDRRERRSGMNAYDLHGQPQFGRAASRPATLGLVADWTTGAELVRLWSRQSQGDGRWDDMVLTDADDPDYWLILNHPGSEVVELDPARTIVAPMEPAAAMADSSVCAQPDPRRFLQVRTRDHFPNALEWHLDVDATALLTQPIEKTADLSTVISGRAQDPGQRLRLAFVRHLEVAGIPIDVFGRDPLDGVSQHRGPLPAFDKRAGIFPYRYTFAAENHAEPNYFTEKIIDAVLGEAVCFYWGCPNLEDHLDPDVFIRLPLEHPDEARHIVERAIAEDEWTRRIDAIRVEKRRIIEHEQILPTMARTIRGHRLVASLQGRVLNLDRRPDRWDRFRQQAAERISPELLDRLQRQPAIDGLKLQRDTEIEHLFRGNDFDFRRGIVGCALSHLAVWREVAASDAPFLILEDDVELEPSFEGRLIELAGRLDRRGPFDIVMLGLTDWPGLPPHARGLNLPSRPDPVDWSRVMGGTFAYLLSPRGATRLVALVERDGIQQGIDWFVAAHCEELDITEASPNLVTAELVIPGSDADSDVEHDLTPMR